MRTLFRLFRGLFEEEHSLEGDCVRVGGHGAGTQVAEDVQFGLDRGLVVLGYWPTYRGFGKRRTCKRKCRTASSGNTRSTSSGKRTSCRCSPFWWPCSPTPSTSGHPYHFVGLGFVQLLRVGGPFLGVQTVLAIASRGTENPVCKTFAVQFDAFALHYWKRDLYWCGVPFFAVAGFELFLNRSSIFWLNGRNWKDSRVGQPGRAK